MDPNLPFSFWLKLCIPHTNRSNGWEPLTIKTGQKLTFFQLFNFLETHPSDNSGQPHALEHMVFQGSKNYPQKVKYYDII